jgi:hypothetical protein
MHRSRRPVRCLSRPRACRDRVAAALLSCRRRSGARSVRREAAAFGIRTSPKLGGRSTSAHAHPRARLHPLPAPSARSAACSRMHPRSPRQNVVRFIDPSLCARWDRAWPHSLPAPCAHSAACTLCCPRVCMLCCPACALACVLPSPLRACEQRAMVPRALQLSLPAPACLLGRPHMCALYCSSTRAHTTAPVWGCALLLPHVDFPIHLPCLPLHHYRHAAPMPSPPPHLELRTQSRFSA